jgi:hypothetical protein
MTKLDKCKALLTALLFSIIMVVKWVVAKIVYPVPYLLKGWVYGNDSIKNYTIPDGVARNPIKWVLWLFLDDDQPLGYPVRYAIEILGHVPETKWDKFRCAYAWSAWRNPAYNVNYNYFGNQSTIAKYYKEFGNYEWNRKLRSSNGDNDMQLVWFSTMKAQSRFIFSLAKKPFDVPITMYFGWNPNFNGRFTVAFKFK